MAAIDFPATPTNGQLFTAGNGVTYRWVTPPGIWTVASAGNAIISTTPPANPFPGQFWFWSDGTPGGGQLFVYYDDGNTQQWVPSTPVLGQPTSPGGDFCAIINGSFTVPAVETAVVAPVVSGNSGGWYNVITGVYRPPAGRYKFTGVLSGNYTSGAQNFYLILRKNGVAVEQGRDTSGAATYAASAAVDAILDANGSDTFDFTMVAGGSVASTGSLVAISAFPISGVKGPPGDPGVMPGGGMFLYSEQVLSSPANMLTVAFPVGAKRAEIDFWWTTSPLADLGAGLVLQGMSGALPITTASYNTMQDYFRNDGSSAGGFLSGQTSFSLNGGWAQAHGRMNFQRPDAGYGVMQMHATTAAGNRYQMLDAFEGSFAAGTFTGYRITTGGGGNFAVGSFMRCYVVV